MEADWEVEIGPGAPCIEALWPGFIDLRTMPETIEEILKEEIQKIHEAQAFPALARALLLLNQTHPDTRRESDADGLLDVNPLVSLWTSKCDVWALDSFDGDELDADEADAKFALACYIDLMPRESAVFGGLAEAEEWVRRAVMRLRAATCRSSRVDLVIRQAYAGEIEGMGITAYVTGCGRTELAARESLTSALGVFAEAVCA